MHNFSENLQFFSQKREYATNFLKTFDFFENLRQKARLYQCWCQFTQGIRESIVVLHSNTYINQAIETVGSRK
jgi:hypothetical protein